MTDAPALSLRWFGSAVPPPRPAVATGVFDVLHVGHARFLRAVAERGHPVAVGLESDDRVRAWKGPGRPVNPAEVRAEVLGDLRSVAGVFLVSGPPDAAQPEDYVRLLEHLEPVAIAFTAGDPHADAKRAGAALLGAEAWEVPLLPGFSTTALLGRMHEAMHAE